MNPLGEAHHHDYENIVADFHTWCANVIYIVLAVGMHIRHGFWSAAHTLGAISRRTDRALKATANTLALVLSAGFIAVPA